MFLRFTKRKKKNYKKFFLFHIGRSNEPNDKKDEERIRILKIRSISQAHTGIN